MRTAHRSHRSITPRSAFAGFRFSPDVIVLAVRWYLRFGLSYRDVEELLTERGVEVDHADRAIDQFWAGHRRVRLRAPRRHGRPSVL
jgi:transposase-like protein